MEAQGHEGKEEEDLDHQEHVLPDVSQSDYPQQEVLSSEQQTATMLALELDNVKISKNTFFQTFVHLWAKRKSLEKLKTSPHLKLASDFVGTGTNKLRERFSKQFLDQKKRELQEKMKLPPFVRTIDKLVYTVSILLMLATEALIDKPDLMYKFYTALMIPLMLIRFSWYHRLKWHYFMLDFCYYCQVLLLFYIYWHHRNPVYFQFVFCLSNGPLAWAIVMWKNSLVFHDIDKMISLFIHIFPPIVTYCLRWWPSNNFVVCQDADCSISWSASFWMPLVFYAFWQAVYIFKTELMDKKKLASDMDIMTSLRWFIRENKPHPIYKSLLKKGIRVQPLFLLILVQLAYTALTLVPMCFAYQNFYLHSIGLLFVFCACTWYGATFYFEVFSESYTKRLKARSSEPNNKKRLPTSNSFVWFCLFAIPALVILYFLIEFALAIATPL